MPKSAQEALVFHFRPALLRGQESLCYYSEARRLFAYGKSINHSKRALRHKAYELLGE